MCINLYIWKQYFIFYLQIHLWMYLISNQSISKLFVKRMLLLLYDDIYLIYSIYSGYLKTRHTHKIWWAVRCFVSKRQNAWDKLKYGPSQGRLISLLRLEKMFLQIKTNNQTKVQFLSLLCKYKISLMSINIGIDVFSNHIFFLLLFFFNIIIVFWKRQMSFSFVLWLYSY